MGPRRRRAGRRRGFSLTDLAVSLALVALVAAVAIPAAAGRAREQANRIKCASNLRQIGLAMMMYANENKGNFPRTYFDPASPKVIADTTGYSTPNSFGLPGQPSPVGDNNVCASFFLTLKTQDITPETFICPSSDGERGFTNTDVQSHSNWEQIPLNLSYSYQVPFPAQSARNAGFKFNNMLSSGFGIAGDMNPGGQAVVSMKYDATKKDMRAANSPNHYSDGQNILYGDGHCEWQSSPFAGSARPPGGRVRDNVYTYVADPGRGRTAGGVLGQPADQFDTILLPVYSGPPRTDPGLGIEEGVMIVGALVVLAVIALIVVGIVMLVRKSKGPPAGGPGPGGYAYPAYPPGGPGGYPQGPPPPGWQR